MGARLVTVSADRHDELLCHLMAEHDAACTRCGCKLRGIDRCPECGRGFQVRMGLVRPRGRAYMAGLVGLVTGTGFSGLLLLYFLFRFYKSGFSLTWGDEVAICGAGAAIEGLLLALWVYLGAMFRRMSPTTRRALVTLAWVAATADLGLFLLLA